MDLEKAFGKKVDLLVSPPEGFVERIKKCSVCRLLYGRTVSFPCILSSFRCFNVLSELAAHIWGVVT